MVASAWPRARWALVLSASFSARLAEKIPSSKIFVSREEEPEEEAAATE